MNVQFLLKNTGMFERLGIMTLSSVLKANGHKVKLTLTEEMNEEENELYPEGVMPQDFKNKLSVDAIDKLVDFISQTEG